MKRFSELLVTILILGIAGSLFIAYLYFQEPEDIQRESKVIVPYEGSVEEVYTFYPPLTEVRVLKHDSVIISVTFISPVSEHTIISKP